MRRQIRACAAVPENRGRGGLAVAGIFRAITPIHRVVGATCVYLGAVLAFLVTGFLLRSDPAWRGWAVYSLIASLATLVLVAITFYTFSPSTPPTARVGETCAAFNYLPARAHQMRRNA